MKKKKKKKRGMFRFIVVLLLLVVFVLLFQTRSIKVKGNEYYERIQSSAGSRKINSP